MTTPSTSRKAGPLLGTGSQTTWPFTFKVFAATDIAVTIADSLGVETALVYGVDFNVTLNANQETSPGGTVTYPISGSALPVGKRLVIIGNLPYDQPLDLPSGGNFSPLALENQLDRLTMQIQQLRENVGRALQVSVTTNADVSLPAPTANQLIGWDAGGSNLQNVPLADIATALAFATYRFDTFTGDGVETQFTLSADPATLGNLDIAVGGVTQTPGTDYTLVSGALVFSSAPPLGATILARYGEGLPPGTIGNALDVAYTPAGAGAVVRTAESKLREIVSVTDFGAVGDGNEITGTGTDNHAAIQAALDSVSDTYGGAVYFPRGIYATTGGFRVKARTVIIGDGWDASMVMLHKDTTSLAATANAMFYVDGPPIIFPELPMRYVHFRRISLHGLDYVIPAGDFFGIKFRRTQYSSVVDCEVKSFWRDGIVFAHAPGEESNTSNIISGCMIRDNNSDGIVLQKANNIQILNNIIRTNSGQGIEFEGDPSLRTRITNNLFQNNLVGGILCAQLTNYGIQVVNSPGSDGTRDVDIIANRFTQNGSSTDDPSEEYLGAIHATNVNYWNICSNSFSSVQEHGIYLGGDNCNISDNFIIDIYRNGIQTVSGSNANIANNKIVACGRGANDTYYGIQIKNAIANVNSNSVSKQNSITTNLPKYAIQIDSASTSVEVNGNSTVDSAATNNFNTDATSVTLGRNFGQSAIPQVASTSALAIPFGATLLRVTGTTTITEITKAAVHKGYTIVLLFSASLTVRQTTGAGTENLRLAGGVDFSATANDTLTLISNGTDWYETSRSVN